MELKKAEIENAISNLSLSPGGPGSGDNLGLVFGPILKAVSASVQAMDIIAATLRENNMGHTTVVAGNQKVSTVETLYNMHGHSGFGSMGIGQRGRQTP